MGEVVPLTGIADFAVLTVNLISQETVCSQRNCGRDYMGIWGSGPCGFGGLRPSTRSIVHRFSPSEFQLSEGRSAAALNTAETVHRRIPVSRSTWKRKNRLLVPPGDSEDYQDWWGGFRPTDSIVCQVLHFQHRTPATFSWITNSIAIKWELLSCIVHHRFAAARNLCSMSSNVAGDTVQGPSVRTVLLVRIYCI